jgi:hypothetical protein
MAHDRYLVQAHAVGVSRDVAEAELTAVRAEVCDPTRCTAGSADVYDIAWRRLIEGGPNFRPGDKVRAALRNVYPNAHPDWIDQMARAAAPDETLAKELLR